jgi:hypothetical protein
MSQDHAGNGKSEGSQKFGNKSETAQHAVSRVHVCRVCLQVRATIPILRLEEFLDEDVQVIMLLIYHTIL